MTGIYSSTEGARSVEGRPGAGDEAGDVRWVAPGAVQRLESAVGSGKRWRRESSELSLDQLGETNGCAVFEDRTDQLDADRQPLA